MKTPFVPCFECDCDVGIAFHSRSFRDDLSGSGLPEGHRASVTLASIRNKTGPIRPKASEPESFSNASRF